MHSTTITEYRIPELREEVNYLNRSTLNINILPLNARLDANTILNSTGWYVFRTATASIVDNYVQVTTEGSIIYEGIRYDNVSAFKGKKLKITFEYKNISDASRLFLLFASYEDRIELTPESDWKTFSAEVDFIDSFNRLQICTPNVTATSCTFAIRNMSVVDIDNKTLESRIDKLEEKELTNILKGKKISIIGDSISTISGNNTPYFTIKSVDVGKSIQSYVTWWDVWTNNEGTISTNKNIGGVTLTSAMIGTLQSFTPVSSDIGKTIGDALNYNSVSTKVWSQRLCDKTGATLLANASWSGSRITQRSTSINQYTLSHAWSDYTIGRCKGRDENGNYINPDVILIYRGTNDFSHTPYASIDDYDMSEGIPNTDLENEIYNFRKGYELTIQKLREAYPNAYIICCTLNVFKRVIYDKFPTRNSQYTLPQMNDVIRDIANTMGCGLIEFDKDGITFENCYPTYISDSQITPTHPNNNGHLVMSEKAYSDIKYII